MFSSTISGSTVTTQMSDAPAVIRQCRFFKRNGKCREGDNCKFSHDISTLHQAEKHDNKDENGVTVNPNDTLDSVQEHSDNHSSANKSAAPEEIPKSSTGKSDKHQQKKDVICRYYAKKGKCWAEHRCRFLHEKPSVSHSSSTTDDPIQQVDDNVNGQSQEKEVALRNKDVKGERKKPVRVCRFYKAGNCKKRDGCQFRHPVFANTDPNGNASTKSESSRVPVKSSTKDSAQSSRDPVQRPTVVPTSLKIADLTDEAVEELRSTEIAQLKKRFPDAKLEADEQPETYRITVNPTDPDWPFEVREFEIWVSFPDTYPAVPFIVDMPEDQVLPNTVLDSMVPEMQEWVSAKHGTNQVAGKVDLIFRPFLRWLDRKLETLFTQAARKFKKKIDAKAAGFEFIAFQQIDKPHEEKTYDVPNEPSLNDAGPSPDVEDDKENAKESAPPSDSTNSSKTMSNFESADTNRRGTEVLFRGLQLIDGIGTLICHRLSISIQCARCKNRCEITTPCRRANIVPCTKCQHRQQITFRPSIVHKFSSVVGFLDLEGCIPFDLVLVECEFSAGCINCPKELKMQLLYGQTKTTYCEGCHQKMTIAVDATKFQKLVPSQPVDDANAHLIKLKSNKKPIKDPAIQEGNPLPDNGTCSHYKKSFRWLRFPCCGKTYPCDQCHDDNEIDHEMKYAIRMICGHCCKEQPFTNDKPCISCGSMTTRGKSQHWEGGKGCRNKVKMNKNDKQKYSNSKMKTISRKAQRQEDEKTGKAKK